MALVVVHLGQVEARARREEANSVFELVIEVLGEERNRNLVLFALQRCEDSLHLARLVWHEDGSDWLEADLVAILLRHAPLVLYRDARLVLQREFLLG